MGIPDHLTCLLRNLYVGEEAKVRMLYGTTDWFKIKEGVWQGCLLSLYLFNLYTGMRNARLDEVEVGIKIGRRNVKNPEPRYVGDTTLVAESEEELRSLLKEESERASLRLNF